MSTRSEKPNLRRYLIDIETAPMRVEGLFWRFWEQNLTNSMVTEHATILCATALNKDTGQLYTARVSADNPRDDKAVTQMLWEVFEDAEVLIAHNGNKFDIRWCNTRFIKHGLPTPSPYKKIDTLRLTKGAVYLPSYKLDDIASYYGIPGKPKMTFEDWEKCLEGSEEHLSKMMEYNINDVYILDTVYDLLANYGTLPYNAAILSDRPSSCPQCGSYKILRRTRLLYTKSGAYVRYACNDCGRWFRHSTTALTKDERPKVIG